MFVAIGFVNIGINVFQDHVKLGKHNFISFDKSFGMFVLLVSVKANMVVTVYHDKNWCMILLYTNNNIIIIFAFCLLYKRRS